jgi:hypothetical protein
VEQSLSYIIKVIYFVPLVCYECSVLLLSETNSGGHDRVIDVGFAVGADMEGEPSSVKTLPNPGPNIEDGLSA